MWPMGTPWNSHPGEPQRVEPIAQARPLVDHHVTACAVVRPLLHGSGVVTATTSR